MPKLKRRPDTATMRDTRDAMAKSLGERDDERIGRMKTRNDVIDFGSVRHW